MSHNELFIKNLKDDITNLQIAIDEKVSEFGIKHGLKPTEINMCWHSDYTLPDHPIHSTKIKINIGDE